MESLNKLIKSWWFPWLMGGVVLRLVLMPITIHPHAYDLNFTSYLFSFKGVINVYDYLANLPSGHPWVEFYSRGIFTYPPLAYFTLGLLMFVLKPFFNLSFIEWFVNHPMIDSLGKPELFWHLFLLKLPYLFFDLGVAFLLLRVFKSQRNQKIAFLLWLFNPLSLYTSFIVSQFDIIPVFFMVLALFLALKDRKSLSLVSLSLGGSFKLFPLWLVPLFVIVLGKSVKERIKLFVAGILPYLITILPFIFSPVFRQIVIFSGQSQKMLFMGLPVSGAESLYIFVAVLSALWFWAYYKETQKDRIWIYILATFLLFFSVTHYHPQWFLWVTPFLMLELVHNKLKHLFLVATMFFCWLTLTLLFEPSLSYGAFSPVWPQLTSFRGLSDIFSRYTDVFMVKSLIRSVFAAASLVLIIITWKKNAKTS